jgi:hypothetical protein
LRERCGDAKLLLMSADYLVAGRRRLPAAEAPRVGTWSCDLDFDDETGIELRERPLGPTADDRRFAARLARRVGFTPASVVIVHRAWSASEAVARALAAALEGAVFSELEDAVIFDARGTVPPGATREALEARLRSIFAGACEAFFDQEEREAALERARFAALSPQGPDVSGANDWSDLDG